ncbi:hypothetical protein PRIPAC_94624 [Pristionchus pacificus]|uniref:NPA domain-containing protein n=1 Tax=Pristionchus pacificus TaxID=54126 RepID=A0A454XNS2_PRIPA|nr:hypothetical protein PRIPAC_94624 [Pristionchus pacificus]|eukprot:PDM63070.1 hypothetical protein PRIPAC_50285 [Pristionchus pacificus]
MRPLIYLFLLGMVVIATASHHYHHSGNDEFRARRDVDALIEKHLKWLSEEQKQVIRDMKKNGATLAELKTKLMSYITDGDKEKITSCDTWYNEVTSAEERRYIKELAGLDRTLCRRKLGEYMTRLSPERKAKAQETIEGCLKEVCGVVQKPRSRRTAPSHWELSDAFYMNYIPDADRYFNVV